MIVEKPAPWPIALIAPSHNVSLLEIAFDDWEMKLDEVLKR